MFADPGITLWSPAVAGRRIRGSDRRPARAAGRHARAVHADGECEIDGALRWRARRGWHIRQALDRLTGKLEHARHPRSE
jgi:hypothetical protein